jgi:hypothetical protein
MIVGSNILAGASGQAGYFLNRSVRIRSSAAAYFNRTPAVASNRQTWTWSGWVKRGVIGASAQTFFCNGSATGTNITQLLFSADTISLQVYDTNTIAQLQTTAVYRDPAAWYHVVAVMNTTDATASNRMKLYVNGVQVTAFTTALYPTLNLNAFINTVSDHSIGNLLFGSRLNQFDGYVAEVNFVDGQALTPTSFGAFNPVTGVWQPSRYIGTYGTNGFYLPFNYTNTNLTGNLITYSEDFSNASWTKYQATITADATTAPNGTTTADKIIATVTPQDHLAYKTFTAADNTTYCLSIYAKNAGYDLCRLYIMNKAGSPIASDFFLSTQTFTAGAGCTCAIVSVGNGWYRCSVSLNVGTGATATPNIYVGTNTGATNGDGTSGIFIWGAQLEQNSSVGPYFATGSASTPNSYNLGADQSLSTGGYNSWVTNNISLTAGVTYDSMTDVPTLTSVTQGNYCTLNPLNSSMIPTSGNLNLEPTGTSGNYISASTLGISTGKWYYEIVATTYTGSGQAGEFGFKLSSASSQTIGTAVGDANGFAFGMALATTWYYQKYGGAVVQLTGLTSATTGTIAMVAVDFDAGLAWVGKDGTWYNSGNPATGANPTITGITAGNYVATIAAYRDATRNYSYAVNFGQRPFSYTPPTGFNRLNTYNLPAPTISNGALQMDVKLYTGNGGQQTQSGLNFQPDFVWVKSRSNAFDNGLANSVTGVGKYLISNSLATEVTDATGSIIAFNSNGFGQGGSNPFGANTATYAAWCWKASNATAVSNTSGSITSQVSANPSAGFSIVTYTGNGTAGATVGHGLGIAPSIIIVKCRNTAATGWLTYVRPLTATSFLQLETTNAVASNATAWNNTAPTSTVFSLGTSAFCNGNTQTYVAYCWSEIAGYSRINSYTGNSSTDGTFVYTGMRPRYILIKNSTSATGWAIFDTSRNPYNVANNLLMTQTSAAETSYPEIDILSNGFKLRGTNGTWNTSGNTYIFMAFAENPFKFALAR